MLLSEADQLMVELLALFYLEISSTDLARMLRYLFARTSNNYTFDSTMVERIFNRLAKKGLVKCESGRISCNPEFVEIACRNAVQLRRVPLIRDAINQFLNNRSPSWSGQRAHRIIRAACFQT